MYELQINYFLLALWLQIVHLLLFENLVTCQLNVLFDDSVLVLFNTSHQISYLVKVFCSLEDPSCDGFEDCLVYILSIHVDVLEIQATMFDSPFLFVHEPCFHQIQLPLEEFFVAFERASTKNLIEFYLHFPVSGVLTLNNCLFVFGTLLLDHDIDLLYRSILKLLLNDRLLRCLWNHRLNLWDRGLLNRWWLNRLGLVPSRKSGQVLIHGIYNHRLLKMHL